MSVPEIPDGALLTAAASAPAIDIETIAPDGTVLIVSPHPDDETFGCGLAMAAAAARGRRIAIVLLTDGEGSHPGARNFSTQELVDHRSSEFDSVLEMLVPSGRVALLRLHLPDGESRYDPDLMFRVLPFAQERDASVVWSTWKGDPHCDHETAAALGCELAEKLSVPLWSFAVWGRFGECAVPTGLKTFLAPELIGRKRQAIAMYRSQIDPHLIDDPDGFTMPAALITHFAAHPEIFIRG